MESKIELRTHLSEAVREESIDPLMGQQRLINEQPGSYQFVGRISTDKRARVDGQGFTL